MLVEASHTAMATQWTVALHTASEREGEPFLWAAFEEIDRIDALLSRFRPTSEIARIVREARRGPVTTDPEVFELLAFARAWSERTAGAFDITVAPWLREYGFPSPEGMNGWRVGWDAVLLNASSRTVEFTEQSAMELDLGAIGKGHGVDRVARLLREHGVEAALISAGSSTLYGLGAPPDNAGWTVHVRTPESGEDSVLVCDKAISTSGCAENFVEREGERHGHLFDPQLGRPVRKMRQTQVMANSALESEVLSTAIFVLGLKEGAALLQKLPDAGGLLLAEDGARAVRWPVPLKHTVGGEAGG